MQSEPVPVTTLPTTSPRPVLFFGHVSDITVAPAAATQSHCQQCQASGVRSPGQKSQSVQAMTPHKKKADKI